MGVNLKFLKEKVKEAIAIRVQLYCVYYSSCGPGLVDFMNK